MRRPGPFLLLVALIAAATCAYFHFFPDKPPPPPPAPADVRIDPSGGEYFSTRVEIPVPLFRQNDARWGKEPLAAGVGGDTLGSAGCAVTSAAMVLASYGIDTDPSRLNRFLETHDGFTGPGWLKWEIAPLLAPEKARFCYEDVATYPLIDSNLKKGNPVIVRLRYQDRNVTHFVVICGKEGHDYLIRDPGAGAAKGVYPLKEFGSKIEALRYYEKILPPSAG